MRQMRIYWPQRPCRAHEEFLSDFPLRQCTRHGYDLPSAPIGTREYTHEFLGTKIASLRRSLEKLHLIRDPQARLHTYRLCPSACLMPHVFRKIDHRIRRMVGASRTPTMRRIQ